MPSSDSTAQHGAAMSFASLVTEHESTADAVNEIVGQARQSGVEADVAFLFFTAHHRDDAEQFVERIWLELDPQVMLGCSAEGVIGGDLEVERAPGMSLLLGQMPRVRLHPFHIGADDWRPMIVDPEKLTERVAHGSETRALIGFGDPFTTPTSDFLNLLDAHLPGVPLIGGMASSGRRPGENVIVRNDQVLTDGFVGVSLAGPVEIETVVSQGCRPIGEPMVITRARENVIEQLGGRPALHALRDTIESLDEADKSLLGHGLMIGRAISEYRDSFGRGDFLVRNLMGVDQGSGAIAVADYVRTGQTIQFHVRDAATASEDLSMMLAPLQREHARPAAGALLFSCNGRGSRMFDQACHDITAARAAMPNTPVAGFFAAGELGPVGGKNFIHGHTASLALIRPAGAGA
jgi:small ligand-binding sensory domain FIST